jgi:cation-transporting ATPase I
VIGATAGTTAVSVLAPNWLAKRVAALEPKQLEAWAGSGR